MKYCWNLLLYCLTVLPLKTTSFDPCGDGQVIHSDFKTAERACCVNVLCPAGTQPEICRKDDPGSTLCRLCPRETFQPHSTNSSDMKHCEAKTTCYNKQIARYENSRIRDTVCECNTDLGYCTRVVYQRSRLPQCVKKKCGEGLNLALNCSCLFFPKVKETSVPKSPSCNSSSALCITKQGLKIDNNVKTTYPEKSHGVTEGYLPATQKDQIQHTVYNSSNKDPYSDSGSTVNFWYIVMPFVILIAIILLIFGVVALIKKKRSSSSSSYAKHQHNDSCSNTSENCQLSVGDDDDKVFNRVTNERETPETQEENQRKNRVELQNETDSLIDKHAAPSFLMRSSDKRKLTDNRCVLVESLVLDSIFWSMMLSNGTMTPEIRARIERQDATKSEKNYSFIDYLQKRSHFAFETFIASLIYTKQEHLARMLDQELTAKIKGSLMIVQLPAYVCNLSESSPNHSERA